VEVVWLDKRDGAAIPVRVARAT